MFWIILIIVVVAFFFWVGHNANTQGPIELKNFEDALNTLEQNPNSPSDYDHCIEIWKKNTWIQSEDLFSGGCYDRLLKLCEENSSHVKSWQLLGEVLQRVDSSFGINSTGKRQKNNTLRVLSDNLFKELQNEVIKERILSLINLISSIPESETKELYETALNTLTDNPSSQEAKRLVLDLGRLHYGRLRPDKKPTVYDEQAIQNDIIVRSK